jgi:hypothetical protein
MCRKNGDSDFFGKGRKTVTGTFFPQTARKERCLSPFCYGREKKEMAVTVLLRELSR